MRNLLIRTLKTFVATFLGTLAVLIPSMDYSDHRGMLMTLAIALASSVLTAIMNIPKVKRLLGNYGETPEHVVETITDEMMEMLQKVSEEVDDNEVIDNH